MKAPYRLCWWCNRQFYGNHSRQVATPSGPVWVHAECEKQCRREAGQ